MKSLKLTLTQFEKEREKILALIRAEALPFADNTPAAKHERKERCRDSVLEFMLTYLPHYVTTDFSDYHGELEDYTKVTNEPVFLAGPKETGKSVILTIGDLTRRTCFKISKFIIIMSETEDQAADRAAYIQLEIEENPRIQQDFGNLAGKFLWEKKDFVTRNRVRIKSRGLKQQKAGLLHGAHRPDCFRGEDIESEDSAKNKDRTEAIKTVLLDVVLGGLGPNFSMIWAGNIVSKHCALKQLIDERDEDGDKLYKGKIYKLLQDDGDSLCPDLWPLPRIEKRRRQLGSVRFNKVYQNSPSDPNSKFREEWIIKVSPREEKKLLKSKKYLIRVLTDPMVRPTKRSDTSATIVIGKDMELSAKSGQLDLVVFDARIRKLTTNQVYETHTLFEKKYHPVDHWAESVAFSEWLRNIFELLNRNKEKQVFLRPFNHGKTNKEIHIERLSGPIENGQIRFCAHNGDVPILIDQLIFHGDRSVPDDGPDVLASGLELMKQGGSMMYVFGGEED